MTWFFRVVKPSKFANIKALFKINQKERLVIKMAAV